MKCILSILIFTTFFFRTIHSFGFYNVSVIPSSPTVNDTVKVIYTYSTPLYPSLIVSRTTTINDTVVNFEVCCRYGQLHSGVTFKDTITLGLLPPGDYTCKLNWYRTNILDTLCLSSVLESLDQISFTVSSVNSIIDSRFSTDFNVFSNPANTTLTCTLTTPTPKTTLHTLSIDGREVIQKIPVIQNNTEIDVSHLPAGLYFAVLQNEKVRAVRRFVKE